MKIEIKQVTPWSRALNAARWTVNKSEVDKEPTGQWKAKMLLAEHSPIRLVEYDIKITDAPNFVVNHLVRHHEGCEKFVGTHRSDRTGVDDTQINRLTPTSLWFTVNAQALINISRQRLCTKASAETRALWMLVKDAMHKVDPIMASKMVKNCVYRSFCPELECCGYTHSDMFKNECYDYRQLLL